MLGTRMKKIVINVIGVIFLNYFVCNIAVANNLKFITLDVAPWASLNENTGQYVGIFPEIVKQIEARTGYNINISLTSLGFSRIGKELKVGRHDCTMLIEQSSMKEYVVRGEHIFDHPMGVIPRKNLIIKKYEDLYDLKISVNKVLTEKGQFMDDANLLLEIDSTYEMGLRKVEHGRLDAVAGAIPTIMFLAKKLSFDKVLGEPLVMKLEPIYLQCSKKSNRLEYFYRINEAIKEIKEDGVLKKIMSFYS
jgi:polar amino acid transport system substrate-binding protein